MDETLFEKALATVRGSCGALHHPYHEEAGCQLRPPVLHVPSADRTERAEGDGNALEVRDVHMGERLEGFMRCRAEKTSSEKILKQEVEAKNHERDTTG